MNNMTIHHQFIQSYIRLYRPIINQVNLLLIPYELYSSQWSILKLLKQEEALTLAEIANRQQVEKPTVTKIVQKLNKLEYVEATQGEDKREKWIRLTNDGHEVHDEIVKKLQILYANLLGDMSEEALQDAIHALDQAHRGLTE